MLIAILLTLPFVRDKKLWQQNGHMERNAQRYQIIEIGDVYV